MIVTYSPIISHQTLLNIIEDIRRLFDKNDLHFDRVNKLLKSIFIQFIVIENSKQIKRSRFEMRLDFEESLIPLI